MCVTVFVCQIREMVGYGYVCVRGNCSKHFRHDTRQDLFNKRTQRSVISGKKLTCAFNPSRLESSWRKQGIQENGTRGKKKIEEKRRHGIRKGWEREREYRVVMYAETFVCVGSVVRLTTLVRYTVCVGCRPVCMCVCACRKQEWTAAQQQQQGAHTSRSRARTHTFFVETQQKINIGAPVCVNYLCLERVFMYTSRYVDRLTNVYPLSRVLPLRHFRASLLQHNARFNNVPGYVPLRLVCIMTSVRFWLKHIWINYCIGRVWNVQLTYEKRRGLLTGLRM